MRNRPRIVLDTNILISALVFGGKPRKVIELLSHGRIEVVISEEILTELRRNIVGKFVDFVNELAQMEILLEQDAELVKLGSLSITVCRDPDDNRILETAVIGECGYIVSGDKDLLILEKYDSIRILKPADFFDIFSRIP
jgi:putative PIN family toxin of toxin-antitoxin system